MPVFTAKLGSFTSQSQRSHTSTSLSYVPFSSSKEHAHNFTAKMPSCSHTATKLFASANSHILEPGTLQHPPSSSEAIVHSHSQISADWQAAKAYKDGGFIYNGMIEGFNGRGLIVRFYSLLGFLPFALLSPLHSCKEPKKTIQEIAEGLLHSLVSVKVIQVDEFKWNLILSEKEAAWSRYSEQVKAGHIFEARVSSVEDYGALVHLRFPDGLYHLTGLVHISELSWDLVGDVSDILTEGDEVRVKVISVDREKSRIYLSIKQLEEDPLLDNLNNIIPQDGLAYPNSLSSGCSSSIQPLPGLERILEELLQEDGINAARIRRQGFENRVVSQDLRLWLSDAPPTDKRFSLLARVGKQVQEIHLTTSLDQDSIKRALQRVLKRVA